MSIYRFSIDDFTILQDQPKGWDKMELNIARDDWGKALFITYLSDLTLWGDGWDYCSTLLDVNGLCSVITIKIEVDRAHNGNFKTLFTGYGDFSEAKIDHEKCEITIKFKDNVVMKRLSEAWDHSVWPANPFIEATGAYMLNGSALLMDVNDEGTILQQGSCCRMVEWHKVSDGSAVGSVGYGYKVIEMLNYIMGIISNGEVKVVSDFFTQNSYVKEIWNIYVSAGAIATGQTYSISYTNIYGHHVTGSVGFNTNDLVTLADIATELIQHQNLGITLWGNTVNAEHSYFDNSKFSYTTVSAGPPHMVVAESWGPITNFTITCSDPATTFACSKVQPITYGMKNLYMGFTHELAGESGADGVDKTISFKRLFDMLDDRFSLGMSLLPTGSGNYELRIEPLEYFFNNPEFMDLGGVMNVKSEYNDKLTIKNLSVGTRGATIFGAISGRKQNWNINQCFGAYEDRESEANYDIASIFAQSSDRGDYFNDKYPNAPAFFLVDDDKVEWGLITDLNTVPAHAAKPQKFLISMFNTALSSIATIYAYNAGLINYWAVRNHLFIMNGDAHTGSLATIPRYDQVIYNTDEAKTRRNFLVESILTDDDIIALTSNPFGGIGFDMDEANHLTKGLYEMSVSVNTGKAKFKLFG